MKTIPCYKRRLPQMPYFHIVLTWDDGSHWINGWSVLCWVGTFALVGATYALL